MFGSAPFRGNPLAVVVDAEGLTDADMARIANWTNLSETTFLLPPTAPGADYRVRIFTPAQELPFAGHPTLGTCHAWLTAAGGAPREGRVVQECGVGPVTVRVDDDGTLWFAAPPLLREGPVEAGELAGVAAELGLGAQDILTSSWVDNGPGWIGVEVRDRAALHAIAPGRLEHKIGVVALDGATEGHRYEVRAFFPIDGMATEDPVTGSLNASVAQWLIGAGRVRPPYTVAQGAVLGRDGCVRIDADHIYP